MQREFWNQTKVYWVGVTICRGKLCGARARERSGPKCRQPETVVKDNKRRAFIDGWALLQTCGTEKTNPKPKLGKQKTKLENLNRWLRAEVTRGMTGRRTDEEQRITHTKYIQRETRKWHTGGRRSWTESTWWDMEDIRHEPSVKQETRHRFRDTGFTQRHDWLGNRENLGTKT